ncbi:hypothetical protein FE257_001978 [Aspergillus nanangensis]|uniref:FAD/NAD(P)-binding domain-containing protein n=1 Tax=Aspergillus nanangensis TaxID=2582783 RepID=A0AAD4GPA5_ASPNN|nr:hypothetical protein FE257_001978 [Aspergillus nanangensis]
MGSILADQTRQEVEQRYQLERSKQLQGRDLTSVEITTNDRFKSFGQDPWVTPDAAANPHEQLLRQQQHHRVLVLGAGFGGLLFAIRLIQSGAFTAEDIVLLDTAGGFGGTWYWNRYPGLMCDVESYIYMPLLEETGYMPRDKYASGNDLRGYAELLAQKWGLTNRAIFRTSLKSLDWDDQQKQWRAHAVQTVSSSQEEPLDLTAEFVMLASGTFAGPKMPDFSNVADYKGPIFHTSRWDYTCTGGSPENPEMIHLHDKKVGVIGTGATAIQVVPQLSRWAKELVVFQRTPSSVDQRNNRPTDPAWWDQQIQSQGPGWQRRRMENFNAFISNDPTVPSVDMVGDGWTSMQSFSVLTGSKRSLAPGYLEEMHERDLNRQEQIRHRVRETVQDPGSAEALMPWYNGWCKRPCFHDDYLPAFNKPNVSLVNIRGKRIDQFTERGIVVDGTEHELDVIVLSTGYSLSKLDPASRGDFSVTGRNGISLKDKWQTQLATLHGVVTRDFPNLFFPGPSQAAASANQMYVLDQLSAHVGYIVSEAVRRTGVGQKVLIEPSATAEEAWAFQIMSRARAMAAIVACTPGYYNAEGEAGKATSIEAQMSGARMAIWGEGITSYIQVIEKWRQQGELEGLEVQVV